MKNNAIKKLLLVDIDDTLCNSSMAYKKAQKACFLYLKKQKFNLTEKKFNDLYSKSRNYIHKLLKNTASSHNRFLYFQNLFERLNLPIHPKLLNGITNLYWNTVYKNIKLLPTVLESLKIIKQNKIKIGIVSDLLSQIQITKLQHLDIAQYFDFIVSSEEAGRDKPFPYIFKLAIKKSQFTNNFQVYVIGDNCSRDILGAEKMKFISIYIGKGKCKIADHSIKTFKEVLSILDIQQKIDGYIKFNYGWENSCPIPLKYIKALNKYRNILHKNKFIGIDKEGIGFGNISQRHKNKQFIITGNSTGGIKNLKNKDYSLVSSWDFQKNYISCHGSKVASSESLSHAIIYDTLKNINSVIHIHDRVLWEKLKHKYPTTPKSAKYGTVEMTKEIKKILKNKNNVQKRIIIMGGHKDGIIFFGENLQDVYKTLKQYQNLK